jgi:hypothetical protein
MKVKGEEHAEYGFKKPSDGWHIVEMGEGIDQMKDKDGTIIKDAKGNILWKFPAKIVEPDSEDNGLDISQVVSENTPAGERKIANFLAAIGEFENFEKNFPGDRSFFEEAIMSKIKVKLANRQLKMRTETTTGKDGKEYSNLKESASLKYVPETKEEKSAGKGKAKESAKSTESAADKQASADW